MFKQPALFLLFCLVGLYTIGFSQESGDPIAESQAKKHIGFLASDSLKGRVNFTEEQLIAAEYINQEFLKYGLTPFSADSFYIPFVVSTKLKPQATWERTLYNIVGLIPGKTKPDEVIIFSAHYDHIAKNLSGRKDSIFNGANDNASGVAAVLMLADYFSRKNDNQRTIMFCLFAGEELGLHGSKAFVKVTDPRKIKAVINIEMIGQHNRVGRSAFFIVGSKISDLEHIFKNNLDSADVKLKKEGPDPSGLFYRSDHFSFLGAGIISHSIMCSDDSEPCYHRPCDETDRIDFPNMIKVVKAIALASTSLISGADSPKWKKSGKSKDDGK